MKKIIHLFVATFTLGLSAATPSIPDSFKLGLGFSGHSNGATIDLDVTFPSLFGFSSNGGKTRTDVHLYLEGGDQFVNNLVQDGGNFKVVHNQQAGGGVRMQTSLAGGSGIISPYSLLGAEVSFLNTKLSTDRTSLAFRAGLGCDLFVVRDVDTFLGTSSSAFFIEGNLHFFHKKATAVAGAPVFRDGFTPRIGFRSHF